MAKARRAPCLAHCPAKSNLNTERLLVSLKPSQADFKAGSIQFFSPLSLAGPFWLSEHLIFPKSLARILSFNLMFKSQITQKVHLHLKQNPHLQLVIYSISKKERTHYFVFMKPISLTICVFMWVISHQI